ncbi:methionine ABC transporter ATP-binding protein [Geomicrobium sp. JSM 1781026]|uniref:methionine ABC transporter ATP-binding protein n=1 Tax=Geomicrobium sp. JSM 1781026 TaxID=3344580 RepID=UPI0035BEDEE9
MITFEDVSKIYETKTGAIHALKNVNVTIDKGEIHGVIGLSGAGKSTLIRCVNLIERPTSGRVLVDGIDLSQKSGKQLQNQKQNIGMIFQHFNLLQSRTVFQNIAMPLTLQKKSNKEITERVEELLQFVGLEHHKHHYPEQLSGGQKQRVGIARALASNPSILLCDEATSALDPETTNSILQLIKEINKQYQITVLLITHEMSVIQQICDRVSVMDDGEIVESGSVIDVFSKPQEETTKKFVKSVFQADIPSRVMETVKTQDEHSKVIQIEFIGSSSSEPILSQMVKKFGVDVNVLYGNITEIQQVPFGHLVIQIQGEEQAIEQAIDFVYENDLSLKEVA